MNEQPVLHPLSHAQKRIWFTEKLHSGTSMWNNAGTLKISGEINLPFLERAVNAVLKSCDSLRTRITVQNAEPLQYIHPYSYQQIPVADLVNSPPQALLQWEKTEAARVVPYLNSPLYYFAVLKLNANQIGLFVRIHHIISDAYSLITLVNRIIDAYGCFLDGREYESAEIPPYSEYIENENKYLISRRCQNDREYLTEKFKELPEPPDIKTLHNSRRTTDALRGTFFSSAVVMSDIKKYCADYDVSVFSLILSAFFTYLYKTAGKDDLIIGTSVLNRVSDREKDTFGIFVGMAPLRVKIQTGMSFLELNRLVADELLSALRRQKYPYNLLMEELRKENKGINSLFDITVSFQNAVLNKNTGRFCYEVNWHAPVAQTNGLDIHFNDRARNGYFTWDYNYLTSLFAPNDIEQMHGHVQNLLSGAIAAPQKKISELSVLSVEQQRELIEELRGSKFTPSKNQTLAQMFKARVEDSPLSTALISSGKIITAQELDRSSDALAAHLNGAGIRHGDIVIVMMRRCPALFTVLFGILKAGAAFLPIDSNTPQRRAEFIAKKSGAAMAIADAEFRDFFEDLSLFLPTMEIDNLPFSDAPKINHDPSSLAYIIFTSGTTGEPKGVMIENKSICGFIQKFGQIMDFKSGINTLSVASPAFDIFVMESFPALMQGGAVVLAEEADGKIPQRLSAIIKDNNVNSLMFMPSRMQFLLNAGFADCLKGLKQIMLGGEELTRELVKKLCAHTAAEIYNFYGPTECTIAVSYQKVTDKKITIGRPMAGVNAYIAAQDGSLATRGTAGELLIGGDSLARGYIADEEKTSAVFIPNSFEDGGLVYKTGDLVRLTDDGEIEYLGRIDSQVKIRGFRIELNEIKARLAEIDGVTDCAVIDLFDEGRSKYLCAYVCGNPPPFSQIRAALSCVLQHYMLPQYFIRLDHLPITAGGKLNKAALPIPDETNNIDALCGKNSALFTRTELMLADIWEQILKRRPLSPLESFFECGGDSMSLILAAARVARDLGVDVPLNAVYANLTLKGYAALIDAEQGGYTPLQRGADADDYPVSAGQRRLYMLAEIEDSPLTYNVPGAFRVKGNFDKNKFEQAFIKAINIHDSLKTSIFMRDGELRQKIHDSVDFSIKTRKCAQAELDGVLRSLVLPFNFNSPPLIRAEFIEVDNDGCVVFIDMHHIISDGVSAELLFKHIARLYNDEDISAYPLRYVDYSLWQSEYFLSDGLKRQREYWHSVMSGELPQLALRTDYPRKKRQSFKGRLAKFDFPQDLRRKIGAYAAAKNVTAHTVMLGAFYILLHRYSGNEDVIAGIPTAGRSRAEFADITGMFVNTLALRAFPEPQKTTADFFAEVNKAVIGGMVNQDYPFELFLDDLKIPRDLSRNPLFDVFFSYNTSSLSFKIDGVTVEEIAVARDISKFDLSFEVRDTPDNLRWGIEYCTDLFSDGTIKCMAEHYLNILRATVADDTVTLGGVEMLTPDEKKNLIKRMRGKTRRIDKGVSFENALKFNAKNTPHNTALIFKEKKFTFAELEKLTARLAAFLKNKGVGRDTIVAICLSRSAELAAAIIAVLRTGAAYLPIDPEYPPDRVAYMLKDSNATIILTNRAMPDGMDVINPSDIIFDGIEGADNICEFPPPSPADLKNSTAYLIYTSGSTGLPKGVRVSYGNLINYCEACREYSLFKSGDVAVSVTTVSFDIFVLEFLVALYHGAAAALCDEEEQRVPAVLAEVINRNNATFVQFTPSRLEIMLEDPAFCRALAGIKTLVCGGEAMTEGLLAKIKKITKARIINFYGPTETTVYSTLKDLTNSRAVTIGKPVLNTYLYILDASMNLTPQGVIGELYIGGDGVALGYHNRQELTAERFINDFIKGQGKMYKTGDLACLLPNGEILCLGRADNQIKFGGHRIEPNEIEKVMLTLNGMGKAVVTVRRVSGSDRLCAHYTSSKNITENNLRAHLKKTLPSYMVPAHFMRLEKLPITPSGKVDRKSLPDIVIGNPDKPADATPLSATEKIIAAAWSKILGVEHIGATDDFFLLGGDSSAVIKAQIELLKSGINIKTQDFYENPTVRALCRHMKNGQAASKSPIKKYPAKAPLTSVPPFAMKKILITGATGFLGSHILKELISFDESDIICLVRGSDETESRTRLLKTLNFYFPSDAEKIMSRVKVISGDLSRALNLSGAADTVFNCAAETRHYGDVQLFTRANVDSVANLIEYCKKHNAALCHISTVSVSGGDTCAQNGMIFNEDSFYIGQNYSENPYVNSKFKAEALILGEVKRGLTAKIMRVGNLMPRYDDGLFQSNPEKNAFFNRLKSFKAAEAVPLSHINKGAEFTPVDQCARAAVLLAARSDGLIYHLFNPNRAQGSDIIGALNTGNSQVKALPDNEFAEEITRIAVSRRSDTLNGIIEDIVAAKHGKEIKVTCQKTSAALSSLGFIWGQPDIGYLTKAFKTLG